MNTPDQELITSLRPDFSKEDIEGMKLYFQLSRKYNEEL